MDLERRLSVVIRAKVKEVQNNVAIYSHALPRIHVIGGQRSVRIAPPSLPPHHSGPATRDFQSSISVEALFYRCHLDVQGLLHQQLLSSAMVQYGGSAGGAPIHVPLQLTSPSSPSRRHLGVPSASSPVSVWSLRCRLGCSCRGYDIPHWIVYQEVMYPSLWSTSNGESAWT